MDKKIKYMLQNYNIILDDDQIKVVLSESDKLLVVAGAGSGKTLTMIAKIYYLINYKKIEPYKILMIAFTNEAVNEIKERLEKLDIFSVNVMTFHKLGLVIIEKDNPNIKIEDKNLLIKEIVLEMCQDKKYKVMFLKVLIKYYNISVNKIMLDDVEIAKITNHKEFISLLDFISENINRISIIPNNQLSKLFVIIKERYYKKLNGDNLIDFDMMITKAKDLIINENVTLDIDYVFVDEYQDISIERFELLNSIVNKFNLILIAVGDDWQSIYQFAGSKVELFVNWKIFFPSSEIKYLNNTYRNSQELINIAGSIIANNKNQFHKNLFSSKNIINPIKIYYYISITEIRCLYEILNNIVTSSIGSTKIMVLGRYKNDDRILKNSKFINYNKIENCYTYKTLNLYFYTIHSSKGLGFDEVIIVNMKKGKYGFPSKVVDRKIMVDLFGENDNNIEEERRLFYVALTRTKNRVYILAPIIGGSSFLKEIKKILQINLS